MSNKISPLVLIILDGWGIAPKSLGNAIESAKKPFFDYLLKNYPNSQLDASGEAVGLPAGEAGNSEVGHLSLGAGRIVLQDLTRINKAIEGSTFFQNKQLQSCFEHIKKNKSNLHLMGLVGTGTVHSSNSHLYALLLAAKNFGVDQAFVHLFSDGRDSSPTLGVAQIDEIEAKLAQIGLGTIISVTGRYWSMARNNNWDRTKLTYDALVSGKGKVYESAKEVFEVSYKEQVTDEFIMPSLIKVDESIKVIGDKDSVIFFNFRKDRPRQLVKAFVEPDFAYFERDKKLANLFFATMTEYEQGLPVVVLFPQENISQTLSEVLSQQKLKQLHLGESEKYAHVTYFFNGGQEKQFLLEDRIHIPSPIVATYDLKPEMSANEITNELLKKLESDDYNFYVVNFANADMVGHTGSVQSTIKAIETLDNCLRTIATKVLDKDATLVVTADHGNAEKMLGSHGEVLTEHSDNKVPLILVLKTFENFQKKLGDGVLGDVAPTILSLFGIKQPSVMTGRNLLED